LAGLLEVVPILGPFLAAVPAILIALTLGLNSTLLVAGYFALLQTIESNVLVPRIMGHAVGVSPLVGLFSLLAFGTLFGILGAFIAIPLAAIIQVLLDSLLINPEPGPEATSATRAPLEALRTRVQSLRQLLRQRLRGRDSRMGIDPQTPEHVADAVDQHIEREVEDVATAITTAQEDTEAGNPDAEDAVIAELQQATQEIEQAVERVETTVTEAQENSNPNGTTDTMPSRKDSDQTVQIIKPS
jgi:AI-2E family transporter